MASSPRLAGAVDPTCSCPLCSSNQSDPQPHHLHYLRVCTCSSPEGEKLVVNLTATTSPNAPMRARRLKTSALLLPIPHPPGQVSCHACAVHAARELPCSIAPRTIAALHRRQGFRVSSAVSAVPLAPSCWDHPSTQPAVAHLAVLSTWLLLSLAW